MDVRPTHPQAGGRRGWITCPRCGLRVNLVNTECLHCGAPVEIGADTRVDPGPDPPGVELWQYFRRRGKSGGAVYIQRAESWVEVSAQGVRTVNRGSLPPGLAAMLEWVGPEDAEAEMDRRARLLRGNVVTKARGSDSWSHKVRIALPGVPVFAVYLVALLLLGGYWPAMDIETLALVQVSIIPLMIGGFATTLLWASRAGEDAWWAGALLGMAVDVVAGAVLGATGFFVGYLLRFVFGYFFLAAFEGFALGAIGGLPAQFVAHRLRLAHQQGRMTRLETWHIAVWIGGLGALLAFAGIAVFYR